jgi:hypothetical protein
VFRTRRGRESGGVSNAPPEVSKAWQSQRLWSTAATTLKSQIARARMVVLALTLGGAALITLGATVADVSTITGKVLAAVGAVALAVAPIVAARSITQRNVRDWTRARSASEGLKTEIYCYLTGAGKYAGTAVAPEAQLDGERRKIEHDLDDLAPITVDLTPTAKPLPEVDDLDSYVQERLDDQIDDFYRPKARAAAHRLKQFRAAEYALSITGAALGAVAAATGSDQVSAWAPVATTAAAAVAAHVAAERYEHLVVGYETTRRRLEDLRSRWASGAAAADPGAFVVECENAISVENQGWMAGWVKKDGT